MDTADQIYQLLSEMAMQLPSMLAMFGGIVVAVIRWKRHPRVSLTVAISLALMLLHLVVFAIIFATMRSLVAYENIGLIQTYQSLVSVAYNFLLAILTAILISAIFMQRRKPTEGAPSEHFAQARAA